MVCPFGRATVGMSGDRKDCTDLFTQLSAGVREKPLEGHCPRPQGYCFTEDDQTDTVLRREPGNKMKPFNSRVEESASVGFYSTVQVKSSVSTKLMRLREVYYEQKCNILPLQQ